MFNMSLFKTRLFSAAASTIILSAGMGGVNAETPAPGVEVAFNIDAPMLGDALRAFGAQSGTPILFSESLVVRRAAPGLNGTFAPADALDRLLQGSGLEAVKGQGQAVIIRKRTDAPEPVVPPARPPREEAPAETLPDSSRAKADPGTLRIDTVTVTGTSLRGIAPESSPLQIYSREDILGSGVTTTEQFIRTLPQNFGGGSTEFTSQGLPTDGNSQRNSTYGSGANLRGLGSGATLTLLNGNRVAPTSTIGDFVDLSMIPVSALERIDVLSDGASSIYGGDAVAGVINLVLRDDFDGAETGLRYGTVTDGDMEEVRFSQTLGKNWAGGNIIGTYEYMDRDALGLSDRPDIAAPTLLNGGPINVIDAFDLLPQQTRHSLVLSGRQALGDRLEIASTALYSDRKVESSSVGIANTTSVAKSWIESESLSATFSADYMLRPDWSLTLDGTYSRIRNDNVQQIILPAVATPSEAKTESSLWSVGLLTRGDLFALPGGTIHAALGGQFRREDFALRQVGMSPLRDGTRDISAVFAELLIPLVGTENRIPGIDRLELNLSGRIDDYSDFGSTANPKAGLLWVPVDRLKLRGSYSTSFAPPTLGQSGANDRAVGVLPYDFIRNILAIPLPDPSLAGVNYMITIGTAPDLDPETSTTYTAGFDYELMRGRQSLTLSGSYYDIRFEDRLGVTPVPGNLNANYAPGFAFADSGLFPEGTVVFFPSEAQIAAVIDSLSRPVIFAGGATALENIGFINNVSLTRNLASTETSGLDLQVSYETDTDAGHLSVSLNGNYILDFVQRASDTTPAVETLNTLYYPVDLQMRGQVALARGNLTSSLFLNYVDSYATDKTAAASRIDSWTTVDLSLSWAFEPSTPGWLSGSALSLSVTNLFDKMPPRTPPLTGFTITGFDPANASPLGRFVALELRKTF